MYTFNQKDISNCICVCLYMTYDYKPQLLKLWLTTSNVGVAKYVAIVKGFWKSNNQKSFKIKHEVHRKFFRQHLTCASRLLCRADSEPTACPLCIARGYRNMLPANAAWTPLLQTSGMLWIAVLCLFWFTILGVLLLSIMVSLQKTMTSSIFLPSFIMYQISLSLD